MAGSSTRSMENFTAQGMERHQIMMNTEMMKHLRIMNRASVREIMLQHEKTFKEQVHDLHKLYEVQRLLMDKAKSRGRDAYVGVPPPSPGRSIGMSEETHQGQRSNFWGEASPDGMGLVKEGASHIMGSPPKPISDRSIKREETPKSVSSPVRKRKILDLEQLPEDDSDDEIENSVDTLNPTTSSLSGNSRELPKVYSVFETIGKAGPAPHLSSGLQPQPSKNLQVSSFLSGESSSYNGQIDGSRGELSYSSYHGKVSPSLPLNVMNMEHNLNVSERNLSFQNASMPNAGVSSIKNNTMFLPQPDLVDRASQETGRQAHWFFQASGASIVNTPAKFPAQQQQRLSPHMALPENSTSRSHPPTPHLEQRHLNNKSPSFESVGGIVGKGSLERCSPGVSSGAQKDTSGSALAERLGDASKWFLKEPLSQGAPANIVPMPRFETGVMVEGAHGMPGVIAPAMPVANSKGSSQERDMNLWSSQNPILQYPQYQQPPVFQQQVLPPASQAMWGQSSQSAQNSMYSQQQVVYGLHAPDLSQINYRGEALQRNQGEIAGPWNMIGLAPYYSSIPSTPQKPPFKKPPKLVLKNDGVGMELKLVSPEKEIYEKERAIQKKSLNALKRDPLQASSKSGENKSGVQKDVGTEDHKLDKRILSSTGQAKEHSKPVGAPMEPRILATASSSSAFTLSQGASSVMPPSIAQHNLGSLAGTSGSETGSGFLLYASPNESLLQQCILQSEPIFPSPEEEKMVEKRIASLKSSRAFLEKETLPATNAGADKEMQVPGEESSLPKNEIDANSGFGTVEEGKESLDKMLTSEGNAIDVVASSQSESFNTTPQGVQSKGQEEGVVATDVLLQKVPKLEEVKGNPSQQCVNAESYIKDFPENKAFCKTELKRPSSQPVMQAVSVQSTSTDTPSISRREKKRSSNLLDNDLSHGVSGRISSACKNESGSPLSVDRECASAPSLTTAVSESKTEAIIGVSNEDLQHDHDSDSDNLAATILLSFAPKLDLLNEEKRSKDSASEISSSSRKVRLADQGSKTSRCTDVPTVSHSDNWTAKGSQGRKMQGTSSTRRMDRMDHMKVTIKDRHRREEMDSAERHTNEGDVVTKSLTIKLPRVASSSTSNGEAIPISRSKQLNKLNGVTLSGNPVDVKNSHKGNEAVHTPTGRRSSRGPPMGTRAPHEHRSRLHQQTQHRVECSPPLLEKDSGIKEEAGRSISKLEGNMKSKAWGELNRTRSHPRKQFQEMSHRKSQK